MFSVGQIVVHKTGGHRGKVIEHDGDTVYVLQDNGVELEFPARDLTVAPLPEADAAPRARSSPVPATRPSGRVVETAVVPSRVLSVADITPDHVAVLAIIPRRTMESVVLLYERKPGAGRFNALDPARKLNFIAEVTEVPYRVMHQYRDRPSELGLMMGRGLSVRLRPTD